MGDIHRFIEETLPRVTNERIYLYGHSLGGNLVLNYLLREKPVFHGAIVTSPWLKLGTRMPPHRALMARLLLLVWPSLTLPSKLDARNLSHDPQVVEHYRQDPLVHDRISTRTLFGVLKAGKWAQEHARDLKTPLLLMHGTGDRITSARASRDFATRAGTVCTYRDWEGMYHELHNEVRKADVAAAILEWLKKHLPKSA
jgi:alpha-beta hydrolase superfamily lysophospholipase